MEQAARQKMPIPKSIQNAPDLTLGLQLFYEAFSDLSSSRVSGMEEGLIGWSTIQDYCERLDLSEEQTADMHYHINELDLARRKFLNDKEDKRSGNSGAIRPQHGQART